MKPGSMIKLLMVVMWTSLGLAALLMLSYVWFPEEMPWRITLVAALILTQTFARVFRIGYERELGIRR